MNNSTPRRTFLKISAGTVQAAGEHIWPLHLFQAAIRGKWLTTRTEHTYRAEVVMDTRVVDSKRFLSLEQIRAAVVPEIMRRDCENLVHNELRAQLIAL